MRNRHNCSKPVPDDMLLQTFIERRLLRTSAVKRPAVRSDLFKSFTPDIRHTDSVAGSSLNADGRESVLLGRLCNWYYLQPVPRCILPGAPKLQELHSQITCCRLQAAPPRTHCVQSRPAASLQITHTGGERKHERDATESADVHGAGRDQGS